MLCPKTAPCQPIQMIFSLPVFFWLPLITKCYKWLKMGINLTLSVSSWMTPHTAALDYIWLMDWCILVIIWSYHGMEDPFLARPWLTWTFWIWEVVWCFKGLLLLATNVKRLGGGIYSIMHCLPTKQITHPKASRTLTPHTNPWWTFQENHHRFCWTTTPEWGFRWNHDNHWYARGGLLVSAMKNHRQH